MPGKQTTFTDQTSIFQNYTKTGLLSECVGTALLVFYTNWTYAQLIEKGLTSTSYGFTCGLTLIVLITICVRSSGAIFHPGVVLALFLHKTMRGYVA